MARGDRRIWPRRPFQETICNFEMIKQAYIEVIDKTPGMDLYTHWEYGKHPSDDIILSYIDEGAMYYLEEESRLAGLVAVTMSQGEEYHDVHWNQQLSDSDVAVIHILAVMPDSHLKGIGRKLIEKAYLLAKKAGKKALRLDTFVVNSPARGLYEKMNFNYCGEKMMEIDDDIFVNFCFYEREIALS